MQKATFLELCAKLAPAQRHQNESSIDSGEVSGKCTLEACNTGLLPVCGKLYWSWKIHRCMLICIPNAASLAKGVAGAGPFIRPKIKNTLASSTAWLCSQNMSCGRQVRTLIESMGNLIKVLKPLVYSFIEI